MGEDYAAYKAALDHKGDFYKKNNINLKDRGSSGPIAGVSRTSSRRERIVGRVSEESHWQAVWSDKNGKQQT